ncbi:MAG: glycosyltransferase [Lutibacter sp.]|nr:glycosyltransferase [Lutibacter sp.]MBP9600735.1 glycosyltransferase [Lutibacter sp.]
MISIIITLYNKQACILDTVNSVLNQTNKNFELIIINDGSTDNSLSIVSAINDIRIKIYSKSNGGVSAARNDGIIHSVGDYILFLDADDILYPNCLEVFYNLILNFPLIEIYTANFEMIEAESKVKICSEKVRGVINEPIKSRWYNNIVPRIGNTLLKKNVIEKIGVYRTDISYYEDLEFNIRMLSNCSVAYTPEVVLKYNRDFSALSNRYLPLEKEFSWYITLTNKPYYTKLILADNINHSIFNRLKQRDFKSAYQLIRKNSKYMFFILFTLVFFLLKNFKAKLQ